MELKKRLQYQQISALKSRHVRTPNTPSGSTTNKTRDMQSPQDPPKGNDSDSRKCYICGKAGHLQRNCRQRNRRQESNSQANQPVEKGTNKSGTNMICSGGAQAESPQKEDPHMFLLSDSEEEDNTVSLVRVQDGGSKSQTAQVEIAGVAACGIVDTGADITIMGPELFKKVAMVARLKKRQFKEADKVPHTYDRRQFKLDGRLDLDINFGDKTINTPIYVKMDAYDDLLLSEGVCRHLGIVTYHPSIKSKAAKLSKEAHSSARSVRVCLVDSVRLAPRKQTIVAVKVDSHGVVGPLLLEPARHIVDFHDGRLRVSESLVQVGNDGCTNVLLTNTSGSTCKLDKGEWLGLAFEAEPVTVDAILEDAASSSQEVETGNKEAPHEQQKQAAVQVVATTDREENRKQKLIGSVGEMGTGLPWQDKSKLQDLLCKHLPWRMVREERLEWYR